jgi:hypothetical protein
VGTRGLLATLPTDALLAILVIDNLLLCRDTSGVDFLFFIASRVAKSSMGSSIARSSSSGSSYIVCNGFHRRWASFTGRSGGVPRIAAASRSLETIPRGLGTGVGVRFDDWVPAGDVLRGVGVGVAFRFIADESKTGFSGVAGTERGTAALGLGGMGVELLFIPTDGEVGIRDDRIGDGVAKAAVPVLITGRGVLHRRVEAIVSLHAGVLAVIVECNFDCD